MKTLNTAFADRVNIIFCYFGRRLVHFLLDEIVGSALHRCLDAVLMETSIVEVICDRG